jgi:TrmH family RNA methyltransferase
MERLDHEMRSGRSVKRGNKENGWAGYMDRSRQAVGQGSSIKRIESVSNPRVKQMAGLLQKKQRDARGELLAEGIHLVLEACAYDVRRVRTIVYDAEQGMPPEIAMLRDQLLSGTFGGARAVDGLGAMDASAIGQDAPVGAAAAPASGQDGKPIGAHIEWIAATRAVIAKCTSTDTPPPVFAVVQKPHWNADVLFSVLREANGMDATGVTSVVREVGAASVDVTNAASTAGAVHSGADVAGKVGVTAAAGAMDAGAAFDPVVVLDGVQDPGNVGTIIRCADSAGARAVVLGSGSADLYNPKTVRSTMGSLFHLPIIEAPLDGLLERARTRGITLVGTSLQDRATTCYAFDFRQPCWIVFGSEGSGLSPAIAAALDHFIFIPMQGKAESLNVAMASSIILFESLRQRKFS